MASVEIIEELNPQAKRFLDKHLKSRVIQAFAFLGIVNIGALVGIYTVVADTAARLAAEQAIDSTEAQLQGLTKQFDQLSTRTTDGFASALLSLGEAKAKVDAINRDVLGLKELELKQVKEVTDLLNKSSSELVSLIESTKALNEIKAIEASLNRDIANTNKDIGSLNDGLAEQGKRLEITNKWVLFSYDSAHKHNIWEKGSSVAVHIDWQKDHINVYEDAKKELKPYR